MSCVAETLASPSHPPANHPKDEGAAVPLESMMDCAKVSVHLCSNGRGLEDTERRKEAYGKLVDNLHREKGGGSRGMPVVHSYVGVDCEGNDGQSGGGCLMVQVSTGNTAVVEAMTEGDWMSEECMDIMETTEITKVFCDAKGDVGAIDYYMSRDRGGARIKQGR